MTPAIHAFFTALSFGVVGWLLYRVWRGADWLTYLGWRFIAFIVCSSWVVPWYTIWALPLAAISPSRRLLYATLLIQAYLVSASLVIQAH